MLTSSYIEHDKIVYMLERLIIWSIRLCSSAENDNNEKSGKKKIRDCPSLGKFCGRHIQHCSLQVLSGQSHSK
jgi:hypothetical protein